MMKKNFLILMILMLILQLSCSTKRKKETFEKRKSESSFQSVKDTLVQETNKVVEQKKEEKVKTEQVKNEQSELEVKGKAETDKPVEIYDIQNGDTLQVLKVTGNADIYYKKKSSNETKETKETKEEKSENKVEKFLKKVVNENEIKAAAEEIKTKASDIKVKDTTFGVYITFFLYAVIVICLLLLFNFFNKKYSLISKASKFINPKNN